MGDAHAHTTGEGEGIHFEHLVRSASHQDNIGKIFHTDGQIVSSEPVLAGRTEGAVGFLSQDFHGGGRGSGDVGSANDEAGFQKNYEGNAVPKTHVDGVGSFKPSGEMVTAMESLSNVRIPFPPIPKLNQLQAHYTGHSHSHSQYAGHGGSGPGQLSHYGGVHTHASSQYQYPQFHEVLPHAPSDQDQGWRLPQFKRKEIVVPYPSSTSTPTTWTRNDQQDRWKSMGAPLAQSIAPPSHVHGYPGGLGPMGGMGLVGWQQERDKYGRDDCGSGLSRESSRDDINSECEQQFEYEQRFRVDRRKLEMMMTNSPEFGEAAAEFFERIGAETDTCVIWPSRLKIGAKSKKDPHIRVGGQEEGVKRAKLLITEVLDTTTNSRVTMKMDVSYTDHSHIIGKGGNTIRRVMAETNCHIHFPDSNRSNPNEKSNQVSIAGEMAGVERARARVRELTPLLFNFDLPIVPSFQAAPDASSPYLRAIQDQYNIQIMFRQKQKNFHTTTVVVKGCEWECSRVKEATLLLMDHLCTGLSGNVPVVMTMEISPQHHTTVLGKGNVNLKIIMQRTNTTIIFPDAGDPNIPPIKKGSVTISGAIHNVYLARQLLLGSLPIVMMFDLPESLQVEETVISKLQDDQDVIVSIKPKARQTNKSCIIKTQERNSAGLYMARHILLQLDRQEEPLVRAEIPETYKVPLSGSSSNYVMATMPANRGPYLNVNTNLANMANPSPLSPNFMPMTPLYTPTLARPTSTSPWQVPPPPPSTPVTGLGGLPPNHPYLQDYAMLVLNNITRLHQQQEEQNSVGSHPVPFHGHQYSGQSVSPSPSQSGGPAGGLSGHGSSGMGSSLHSSPLRLRSPRRQGRSPRNSSPVNPSGGNLTANLHKLDITTGSSGIGGVSAGSDKNNTAMSQDLSVLLSEMNVGDRRAPGCEKKVVQIATADYEHKKLLATKAIQHKPMGERRTPNSVWSGMGFSSSMPEAVIREKLAQEHALAKQQREKEAASSSDWLVQTNNYDSLLAPVDSNGAGTDELSCLLAQHALSKYTDVFLRHEIDLPTFASLTDEELKEIGIPTFGARKKLLLLAKETKKKYGHNY